MGAVQDRIAEETGDVMTYKVRLCLWLSKTMLNTLCRVAVVGRRERGLRAARGGMKTCSWYVSTSFLVSRPQIPISLVLNSSGLASPHSNP